MTPSTPLPPELELVRPIPTEPPWRFGFGDRVHVITGPLSDYPYEAETEVRVVGAAVHRSSGFPHYLVAQPYSEREFWLPQLRLTTKLPQRIRACR